MGHPPRLTRTTLACLLLLVAFVESASQCTTGCHGMQTSKAYEEKTYVYSLEGLSVTSVTDAQGDASLKLSATVELTVKPDCVDQLRLKNVLINGAPPTTPDIEKYAVQFNYHDGHIDTELCTDPKDSQASLNIKRAVVSLFQSAIMRESGSTTHHETDVMGSCPTEFNFRKEGETLIVNKNRNLAQCAYRENVNQGLISGSMDASAGTKSFPLIASQQQIEQRFKRGVLAKAASKEVYKLNPFSNGAAGAKTVVETTLTLQSEKAANPSETVNAPKSLIFEAPHPVLKSSAEAISNALKAAKAEVANGVRPEAANKVADLVKVLRLSNKKDILSVYQKIKAGAGFAKEDGKLFLDALFRTGTGEAAEVGVELIKSKELSRIQSLLFYTTTLPLVRHVHLSSVGAIASLLDEPNLPRHGYLGIGQAIGKYCQGHQQIPCEQVPEVKQAVRKIFEKVGNGKAKTREQENIIVAALKALGNSGPLDDNTLQKLANIGADKNVRNRVRVAAIEALPNRCTMKWKNIAFKVLGDQEEDSEVRIKAYLSLVACPCPHVASQLKELVDKEPMNQVGSFIQTHLRNLRASTDPSKLNAKNHLGLIKPRNKFPEDIRKFSFNNELSYKLDSLGAGSTLESNVIYSQNSFVPRSTNLNVTLEMFGHNFNFLELNTRVENLDRVIERYFGPKGKIRETEVDDMLSEGKDKAGKLNSYIGDRYERLVRGKREVKQGDLDRFAKKVHLRNNEVDQDLDLDLSVKLFGVELAYLSYQGGSEKLNPEALLDKLFECIEKGFDVAKNLNYDLENYLQFLDVELVYPTGLGSALNLGLTGTSALKMKTHGKVDIAAILRDPRNANLRVALEPSLSVSIAGNMVVQAPGAESGMKIVSTLHTSTSTDISVSVLNGKGVDVNFGVPKKKQEIITFSSEVLFTSGKGDKYVAPKFGKGKEYSDCFDQLSTLFGLTVCGQLSFPYEDIASVQQKPLSPLSGPERFAITIENNDVTSYRFKVHLNVDEPKKRSFEILLDTPNSKTNRLVSFILEAGIEPNLYAKISLNSPIKKVSAGAVLKNTVQERTLTITVVHDQIEYYGRIGVLASGSKYKPVLEYKVPDHIEKLASAKTGLQVGQQYNMQGTVDVTDHEGGQKFVLDKVALVVNGQNVVVVDGSFVWTPSSLSVDTSLGYTDKSLALKVDGRKLADCHYKFSASALPSTDPNIGFNLNWEFRKGQNDLENSLVFIHGADQNSETNRLSLKQKANYVLDPKELLLSASNELKYPVVNLKVKLDGKLTRKSINGDLELQYEKFKLGTELSAKRDMEKPGDYEIELEGQLMENSIELKSKRSILDGHKCKLSNSLELKPGGKYVADATVLYDVSKNNVNVQLDGDMNLNGKKVKVDGALEANAQLVNARTFLKVDGTKYIEFLLNIKRAANPSGSLTLNLKDCLTAEGQFTYANDKGNANLVIEIPKINRKIEASGNLVGSAKNKGSFEGTVQILYDANKDPNKRIKLTTVSDIKKNSVDTKNVLEILTYKFEVNGKGELKGTFNDGELQVEADVTLPNGKYIEYKGKRKSVKKDDEYDVDVDCQWSCSEQKGGPSRKASYVVNAKGINTQKGTFRSNAQLKFVDLDGKDLVISLNGKNLEEGEKKERGLDVAVAGAVVPKKFELQFNQKNADDRSYYTASSTLGNDFELLGKGSFDKGNEIDKPCKASAALSAKLPSEKLSNVKLEFSTSIFNSDEKQLFEGSDKWKLTYNNDKSIEYDSYLKLIGWNKHELEAPSEGSGNVNLKVLELPALKLDGNYKYNPTPEKKIAQLNLNANYGEKEVTFKADNEYLPDVAIVNLKAVGKLNFEKLNNADLHLTYKRFKKENKLTVESKLTADGEKYNVNGEIQHQSTSSLFHVTTSCPKGEGEILSKFEKLGEKEFKGEWKVRTPLGFAVADAHVDLESVDNFVINANFDSDKFKYRKVHAEIANKPTAKTGKRIVVTVTSDGKNIVTGSTSYKKRDEDGKIVVEGNGNLKIGDNTRSSSFKYTRQQLTQQTDGEIGVAMVLNANFGPSAIVGELKLSNKELHVFNSYCEQSKDCAQFKLESIVNVEQKTLLKHQLTVEVDLKKFNVPAEFGLKTSTELRNPIFDHTTNLYLHSSKGKSEYTYQAYIRPKESATILTLPTRELAVIWTCDLPKTKHTGAYKADLSLYLDRKNKPAEKTSLSASGDIHVDKGSVSVNGETKFTYPTQPKDMVLKGNLHYGSDHLLDANVDIDVFAKKSQKISISANLKRQQIPDGINVTGSIDVNSRGQQLKLDLKGNLLVSPNELGLSSYFTYNDVKQKPKSIGFLFDADFKHVNLLVTVADKHLISEEWKIQISKNVQKIEGEVSLLDDTPCIINFEASNFNRFKLDMYSKGKPNDKLSVNGQVVLGQLAEIHADRHGDGGKKELFHVLVHLDEKQFLKPDFGCNKENIGGLVDTVKAKNQQLEKKLKEFQEYVAEEVKNEGKDLIDHLKKAQPNLKPLVDYYQGELNKIKEEISADETIKEIQATLNKYLGAIVGAIAETLKRATQDIQKLQVHIDNILSNLKEAGGVICARLKESYDKLSSQLFKIVDAAAKLAETYLKALLDVINKHRKEIEDLLSLVSGVAHDVCKFLSKGWEQVKQNLEEFCALLKNQLKALPIYEIVKEKFENLKNFQIPENILALIEEGCKTVKNLLPTEELRQLLESTCQYVMKHLKREKVDEVGELKNIYSQLVTAIQSTVSLLQKQATIENVLSSIHIQAPNLSLWSKFPGIPSLKLSAWNLLRNGELPTPLDLYYAYRPTLLASDIIPPFSKSGIVADGGHFFTFDGRHLSLPGACTYVLAQDIEDGNFSVVANFNNGVFISITLTEPKESITLKNNGNILVNNKPADYPASTKNLHAYLFEVFANIRSDYGVRVTCSRKASMVCMVHVSGFYLGKLRGILGDGNNEPYDDFTLPSGKITESGTEFGNAYKLKADCPDATAVEHKDRAPVCTEYFTGQKSPLASCFKYVNPVQYRDACDHAIAANTPAAACVIATAYHYSCYAQGIMSTTIPPSCANCKVGANKIDIGDTFSVKIPNKEADIIFVVEQETPNDKVFKELITPMMSELREELKQQGITDVHIGLVGYNEKMKWPQHYTQNGDSNIESEVKNIKFDEKKQPVTFEEAKQGNLEKKIDFFRQKVDVELGTFKLTDAYQTAIQYRYRPGAAKAVIGVIANPCEKSPFPISLQQVRLLLGLKMYRDLGLTYHHVSFPKNLLVSGKAQKNIVGYDQDSVYTFADSKKKPLTGSSDAKSNLAPTVNDVCADFALLSGGAAFSSDNFLDAKPNQKKQFIQVAVKRVVDGLVNLELEKDCACEFQFGLAGRPKCKIVGRKEVPRPASTGVKG